MKTAVKWLALLTKRLFCQPAFLALLVLIPLLAFGYATLAQGQSGVVTVALSWQEGDGVAGQICKKLQAESQLIRYIPCTEAVAEQMVRSGKVDAAWIFSGDTEKALDKFVAGNYEPFIRVVEREQTTRLLLAREKLSAAVFVAGAEMLYDQYLRQQIPTLQIVSREALLEHYQNTIMSGSLFQFEDFSGMQERLEEQQNYLLSPLRGIVAVFMAVCAMACAMYYCRDEENGVFLWVAQQNRPFVELVGQLIALVCVIFVSLISLSLVGTAGNLWQELPLAVMYALCCAAFGMLLRQTLQRAKVIAAALPLIGIVMLAVCPVFIDLGQLRLIGLLLPPTYFINGIFDYRYLIGGFIYSGVCFFLYCLLRRIK